MTEKEKKTPKLLALEALADAQAEATRADGGRPVVLAALINAATLALEAVKELRRERRAKAAAADTESP